MRTSCPRPQKQGNSVVFHKPCDFYKMSASKKRALSVTGAFVLCGADKSEENEADPPSTRMPLGEIRRLID